MSKKRKYLSAFLVLFALFQLTACGGGEQGRPGIGNVSVSGDFVAGIENLIIINCEVSSGGADIVSVTADLSSVGASDHATFEVADGGKWKWGGMITPQEKGEKKIVLTAKDSLEWHVTNETTVQVLDPAELPPTLGEEGYFIDPRDGQRYKTIKIGTQVWMARNLSYITGNSRCYYDDDPNEYNCIVYGRLYGWETAMNACPSGWHLPSDGEWQQLVDYLGGDQIAGGKMKEKSLIWQTPNIEATNASGFSALPGGFAYLFNSYHFNYITESGVWWSSTRSDGNYVWSRGLSYKWGGVYRNGYENDTSDKRRSLSVRCIRD